MNYKVICSLICLSGIGWANVEPFASPLIRGQVAVKSSSGGWQAARKVEPGQLFRSTSPQTTIDLPGAVVRADAGSEISYTTEGGVLKVNATSGRVFVALKPKAKIQCCLTYGTQTLRATHGQFVVDCDKGNFSLVSGDAAATSSLPLVPLSAWKNASSGVKDKSIAQKSKHLALEGVDVQVASTDDVFKGGSAPESGTSGSSSTEEGDDSNVGLMVGFGIGGAGLLAILLSNNNGATQPESP